MRRWACGLSSSRASSRPLKSPLEGLLFHAGRGPGSETGYPCAPRESSTRSGSRRSRPVMEHKEDRQHDAAESRQVVPSKPFTQIRDRKNGEDGKTHHLLDCLELGGREPAVAESVGRHLEAIFRQGYQPARQDDPPQGHSPELEMSVPGDGHEEI